MSDGQQSKSKRSRVIKTKPGTGVEEYDAYPGPSLLKRTLGLQNLHHSQYLGPNSVPDVYDTATYAVEEANHEKKKKGSDLTVRFVDPNHAFRIIPDATVSEDDREKALIDEIETIVQPYGNDLVQMYFRTIHPAFPILHREVFLEKYARSYQEFSPPLLAMVYLLACGYWSFNEALAERRKPDVYTLRRLALRSLQSVLQRPKLSTIQAMLLLSQHQGEESSDMIESTKTRLTVQLVDLAYASGLHLDASTWDIPDWEVSLRRRLAWAVIIQDKWTGFLSARPSLIQLHEWDVIPLDIDDFPDSNEYDQEGSSEVEKGRTVFVQLSSLTVILSEIMSHVFSARASRTIEHSKNDLPGLLEHIKPLQITLKDWFTSLPESLKMETAASMKLSSVGYLRLAYLTVETCLHRYLVRIAANSGNVDPALLRICRNAAQERFFNSVDFFQRLQAQHLAAFWYFTSSRSCALIYSFGNTLAGTARSSDEEKVILQRLKELKWTFKVNSEAGATFMKQALSILDTPIRLLPSEYSSRSADISPNMTSPGDAQDGSNTQKVHPRLEDTSGELGPAFDGGMDSYPFDANLITGFEAGENEDLFYSPYLHDWAG